MLSMGYIKLMGYFKEGTAVYLNWIKILEHIATL